MFLGFLIKSREIVTVNSHEPGLGHPVEVEKTMAQ